MNGYWAEDKHQDIAFEAQNTTKDIIREQMVNVINLVQLTTTRTKKHHSTGHKMQALFQALPSAKKSVSKCMAMIRFLENPTLSWAAP